VRPLTLARRIARLTHTKKAFDVVIMNLKKLTAMTDYFVICSADSDIQVKAISDAVEEGMKQEGVGVWHREAGSANWILLDYVDVVLHVFHKNTRSFYSLERLWGDAEIVRVDERKKSEKKSEKKGRSKPRTRKSSSVRKEAS
jgi:ribosome-associated protein